MSPPLPPSPKGAGPFNLLGEMGRAPMQLMNRLRDEVGDIVFVRFAYAPVIFVYDPDIVKYLLVDQPGRYRKTTRGYRKLRYLLGNGLVTSDGEFWLRQRRIAQPAFHRKALEGFVTTMTTAIDEVAHTWRDTPDGTVVDVADAMNRMALRIAAETLLGANVAADSERIGHAMDLMLTLFWKHANAPYPWPERIPTPRNVAMWRERRWLYGYVDDIITARRAASTEHPDLLGMFMSARDEETGESMTNRQLRDEAITMLGAGHETTASTLSFALNLLAQHPEVAERLAEEARTVLGDRIPTAADIKSLVYARQVFLETLRLFPPVWLIARRPDVDDEIAGYRVPKGTYLFIPTACIQRHPKHWPDPERFDPDRFAPDKPAPHRFAYFPFSRGQRQCIGDRFAEMEGVMALAMLGRAFKFETVPEKAWSIQLTMTQRPRDDLPLRLAAR